MRTTFGKDSGKLSTSSRTNLRARYFSQLIFGVRTT